MTKRRVLTSLVGTTFLLPACSAGHAMPRREPPSVTAPAPAKEEKKPQVRPEDSQAPPAAYACEDKLCFDFSSSDEALDFLLRSEPLVIGFGEMHGKKEEPSKKTAVVFREKFLPKLAGRSSALVVELLAPASGCEKEKEKTERVSGEITRGQSQTNQNDYLALGQASRALGVVPDILRANCEDMKSIADAGELGVLVLMETIGRKTAESVEHYRGKAPEKRPLVLAYGGMLHNDLHPSEDRKNWSYGPRLEEKSAGRYLEVDVLSPEQIDDEERFSRFDFAKALASLTSRAKTNVTLIERAHASYVLVLPGTRPPALEATTPEARSGAPDEASE